MTLYLKYRPKNLDELDLEDVGESLKKIVTSGEIPHAFLFAGPKGTGKTSAARILAKIINCEKLGKGGLPCEKCEQCVSISKGSNLDVIEIDAASHRGIDDIRILRDALKLSPAKARKKIYIIDEAHMLTTEASNALLKTLEEPPAHVIFILATTNPEKLIDTIRSRVTNIPFRRAQVGEVVNSLKRVVTGEKIKVKDDALELIAKASDGAFRDAIKILEQLIAEERSLTKEFLEEHLFNKKAANIDSFIDLLISKDVKKLIEEIGKLEGVGLSIESFLQSLLETLRQTLLDQVRTASRGKLGTHDLIELIELLMDANRNLEDSLIEELPLEIAVIKWCGVSNGNGESGEEEEKNEEILKEEEVEQKTLPKSDIQIDENLLDSEDRNLPVPDSTVNDDIWKTILAAVKPINASIEALLRSARPIGYDGKVLTLGVFYKFHKERLEDMRHRLVLEDVVAKVLQSPTRIACTLVSPPAKKIVQELKTETVLTESHDTDIIKVAEEIFSN